MKRKTINILLNDQFAVSACLFSLAMTWLVIIQSIFVGIISNSSISKTLFFFIIKMKEYLLVVSLWIIALLRSVYLFIVVSDCTLSTGNITQILLNKTWTRFDEYDFERDLEMIKQITEQEDKRLVKFVNRHSKIAAIEYQYSNDGETRKRKQYFWSLSREKIHSIIDGNEIEIVINNRNKRIAFILIE